MFPPGSTIGMLGGGQLGRMAALAAARLGYHMHIYTPHGDDPAMEVARVATVAAWNDRAALAQFAAAVEVITLEFENVPVETVEFLAALKPVFPDSRALAVAQDRVAEKSFINSLGIETAPWRAVDSAAALRQALTDIGTPAFAKTNRFGYDGKGQLRIDESFNLSQRERSTRLSESESKEGEGLADIPLAPHSNPLPLGEGAIPDAIWQSLGAVPLILEGAVEFEREVSLVMARGQDGAMVFYPLAENQHRNGILHKTSAPATVAAGVEQAAQAIAAKIANGRVVRAPR